MCAAVFVCAFVFLVAGSGPDVNALSIAAIQKHALGLIPHPPLPTSLHIPSYHHHHNKYPPPPNPPPRSTHPGCRHTSVEGHVQAEVSEMRNELAEALLRVEQLSAQESVLKATIRALETDLKTER